MKLETNKADQTNMRLTLKLCHYFFFYYCLQ
ncbi:hypothetical protein JOD18_003675 [Gracilibacillus alcaliphilus]|nr:hypothetical protein [Gracilibacillus alcaliphilus]